MNEITKEELLKKFRNISAPQLLNKFDHIIFVGTDEEGNESLMMTNDEELAKFFEEMIKYNESL